jgi:plasmid stabilization system protein ParE
VKYRVEVTSTATAEIEQIHQWLANQAPLAAERWQQKLLAAVETLEQFPARCPVAPETQDLVPLVRNLLIGRRPNIYRILFETMTMWCM